LLKDTYAYVRGLLPISRRLARLNIVQVFGLRPAYLRAFGEQFAAMWHGPLPHPFKEALGVAISSINGCHY
jgi:alkylhydroperoxidase family enzyme